MLNTTPNMMLWSRHQPAKSSLFLLAVIGNTVLLGPCACFPVEPTVPVRRPTSLSSEAQATENSDTERCLWNRKEASTTPNLVENQPASSNLLSHQAPSNQETNYAAVHDHQQWSKSKLLLHYPYGLAKRWLSAYLELCRRRPLVTKGITAGVVAAAGDLIAQWASALRKVRADDKGGSFASSFISTWTMIKKERLLAFGLVGLLYSGPAGHLWYEQLWKFGKWLRNKHPTWKPNTIVLCELLLDQTLGVAMLTPGNFYVYEILEAAVSSRVPDLMAAHSKCVEKIVGIILTNYYIWPWANWINFTYMPAPLRVLFTNLVGVFWNALIFNRIA